MTDSGTEPGEPTQASVEAEFPIWKLSTGNDWLCYGRRTQGAALTVRGEDWQDLRDEIIRAEAKLKLERPEAWR